MSGGVGGGEGAGAARGGSLVSAKNIAASYLVAGAAVFRPAAPRSATPPSHGPGPLDGPRSPSREHDRAIVELAGNPNLGPFASNCFGTDRQQVSP